MKKSKKKKLVLTIILLSIIVLVLLMGIIIRIIDNKFREDIKKHYNTYVKLIDNTNIYKKDKDNYVHIGKISKDFKIELENIDVKKYNDKYFKIKNSDYYVYYLDVKKIDKYNKEEVNPNYLVFNSNIKTNKTTKLIKDNTYIEINKSFEFPIMYMNDEYYFVSYMNDIYKIEKDSVKEVVEVDNTDIKSSEYISVIDYGNTNLDNLNTQMQYLKDNNYYTITLEEYKSWLKNNIRLKEKAILLTIDNENNDILNKIKEYNFNVEVTKDSGMNFSDNNKTMKAGTNTEVNNRYKVDNTTTIDNFKNMCLGLDVVIAKVESVTKEIKKKEGIAVLNYHFFYDPTQGESCNENICLETSKFREQLQYLKDNGFKTLKMDEFVSWIYGEIELPEKSVLLTIDDGAMGTGAHNGNKLIPILEEYDMHATLFLITGWWDISNYKSDHLDVESHTFDMHQGNICSNKSRGAQMLCSSKEKVLEDLRKSIDVTKSKNAFCFPLYAYDNDAIESVKEVGFKIAFIGGSVKATRSSDKYKIPRYPIYKTTTLNQFINMVN